MESLGRRNSVSGHQFSFPIAETENPNIEFEFGSITEPTSPKSPADHLFYNGRLLPHFFPVQTANAITRSNSVASRVSSKDSLHMSRSSSTIRRTNSYSSSARTSTSTESSEQRKVFLKYGKQEAEKEKRKTALVQQYEDSSQRWQFIAPAPVMKPGSRSKKSGIVVGTEKKMKTCGECFCWRVLKWFAWVCKKCHALEP